MPIVQKQKAPITTKKPMRPKEGRSHPQKETGEKRPKRLTNEPPREATVQMNLRVSAKTKLEFRVYCTSIDKGTRSGEVFENLWEFYKEHHEIK